MRLFLSTAILTLAWFSTLNVMLSAIVWAVVQLWQRSPRVVRHRADVLFVLRLAPSLLAGAFALGVFLPVHLIYEGREGTEYFGALLWSLALVAVVLIGSSALRVMVALKACTRLKQSWLGPTRARQPIVSDAELPGISLAGVVRPTIVVGRRVREALTRDELEVAVAHEVAHRQSWDNVKRFAMFAAPDVLRLTRVARDLERGWCREVECLADARAAEGDATRAASLASALVKVARVVATNPSRVRSGPLWSTFYEEALLELRVRRLMNGPVAAPRSSWMLATGSAGLAGGAIGLTWMAGIPTTVHFFTEALVRLLP